MARRVFVLILVASSVLLVCLRASCETHALVVGIGVYEVDHPRLGPLQFADDDAAEIVEVLREKCGVEHVEPLIDSAATRVNIETWMADVGAVAMPGDTVIVYFAGHGGKVEDQDGDEAYDEALFPYDVRPLPNPPEDGPYFYPHSAITDDVLGQWVANYLDGCTVLVFLDACASGGMIRSDSEDLAARGALGFTGRGLLTTPRGDDLTLVLAACQADEFSYEDPDLENGVFTYFLVKGLGGDADSSPEDGEVTFAELAQFVTANVSDWVGEEGVHQNPVVDCSRPSDCELERVVVSRGTVLERLELAFVSDEGGASNVWLTSLDMTRRLPITANADENVYFRGPKWSPNGDRLLYVKWDQTFDISYTFLCTYDLITEETSILYAASETLFPGVVGGGLITDALWLDDETALISVRLCDSSCSLYRVDVESRRMDPFLSMANSEIRSPDVGRGNGSVVFIRTDSYWGYTGEIYVADILGGEPRRITDSSNGMNDVNNNRGCKFADGGDAILFLRGDDRLIHRLWRMDPDGSNAHDISGAFPDNLHFGDSQIAVGADGHVIVSVRALSESEIRNAQGKILSDAPYDLYLTDTHGNDPTNLTATPTISEWQPDLRVHLDAPVLVTPQNDKLVENPVFVEWEPVEGAATYSLHIWLEEGGNYYSRTSGTSDMVDLTFWSSRTEYACHWQVRAFDAGGNKSAWSSIESFRYRPETVATPPVLDYFWLTDPEYLSAMRVRVSGAIHLNEGTIASMEWDWGDGSAEQSWFPAWHEYEREGDYRIRVTAVSEDGQSWSEETIAVIRTVTDARLWPQAGILASTSDRYWLQSIFDPWTGDISYPSLDMRIVSVSNDGQRVLCRAEDWNGPLCWVDPNAATAQPEVYQLPADLAEMHGSHLKLSPLGNYLAVTFFMGDEDERGVEGIELFVIDLETSDFWQVTHEGREYWGPEEDSSIQVHGFDWSPDEERLVYEVSGILFLIDREGSNRVALSAPDVDSGAEPAWRPHSSEIAYFSDAGISTYDVERSESAVLVDFSDLDLSLGNRYGLAWSPDGRELAFGLPVRHEEEVPSVHGVAEIFVRGEDGTVRRLTDDAIYQYVGLWLPELAGGSQKDH